MESNYEILRKFGLEQEENIKGILEESFETSLFKTLGRYNSFDFIDEEKNLYVEVKSRQNLKDAYPSTMIGWNKLEEALKLIKEDKIVFLVFNFTDKICVHQVTKINDTWKQVDRYNPNKINYLIPVNELEEIYEY